jgi:hypothetical protein
MPNNVEVEKEAAASGGGGPDSDLVWGAEAIGRVINRTARQVHHLHEIGALDGAVSKLGHKTFVGSTKALHRLPFRKIK